MTSLTIFIDANRYATAKELHLALKMLLNLPDYYGCNADALLLVTVKSKVLVNVDALAILAVIDPILRILDAVILNELTAADIVVGGNLNGGSEVLTACVGVAFNGNALNACGLNVGPDGCAQIRTVQVLVGLATIVGTSTQIAITDNRSGCFFGRSGGNSMGDALLGAVVSVPAFIDGVPTELHGL